MAMNITY